MGYSGADHLTRQTMRYPRPEGPLRLTPILCGAIVAGSTPAAMNPSYAPIMNTGPFVLSPNLSGYEATHPTFNRDSAELP